MVDCLEIVPSVIPILSSLRLVGHVTTLRIAPLRLDVVQSVTPRQPSKWHVLNRPVVPALLVESDEHCSPALGMLSHRVDWMAHFA